ncbi:hypothetical [Yersinia pestis KIM10+]|uniref:Uncharacterized protein n=1 Tax=Yersinia pestis TaxID=632 RepID=Q8CLP2_YERPE|nr:hypothetical [Yersinia pestis KIM10+]
MFRSVRLFHSVQWFRLPRHRLSIGLQCLQSSRRAGRPSCTCGFAQHPTPTTWVPFFISSALRAGFNLHPCRLTPFADVLSAHPTCVLQSALADSPFKVNGLKVKIKNQLQMQNQRAKIEPAVV